ncbi:1,2-phenylacetyl-CoA epoxidase subunit PaaC [Ideonella sp. DXS22W]|uniref:1,2-phenylacetyl-CoA epoxidase subunit PaaC n=1 Tax=Pseudaquabacterium inlustre TaxID=2984192 RepID=A0ABU9CLJ7_9BURK
MTASIQLQHSPRLTHLLRIADTALIQAQRLSEWCGHAPILEEDIALTNISLDLIGQTRGLLTHAGQLHAQGGGAAFDEDQLAFLRDERDYRNLTMAELPRGDFAFTVLRNLFLGTWLKLQWERLRDSSDAELAAIAGKALKEARYHQQHAADWVLRLADGTDESRQRVQAALAQLARYIPELFADDAADQAASANGWGPARTALREAWEAEVTAVFSECGLTLPAATKFVSTASNGVHTEHMGRILAEMQYLQRAYPNGVW